MAAERSPDRAPVPSTDQSAAPTTARPRLGHRPALDGIRGIAITMVMLLHFGYLAAGNGTSWFPGGLFGVDVFFVLSGFLITALLLNERNKTGTTSFVKFYARRACRLLPALAAVLAFHLLYTISRGQPLKPELGALASVAFYASNFTQAANWFMPIELRGTWSLAIEEQFYLLWPLVFVGLCASRARLGRLWRGTIPWVLPVTVVVVMLVRIWMWRHEGFGPAYMLPITRFDALLVGCMLAFLFDADRLPKRGAVVAGWVALVGFVALTLWWPETSAASYYGVFTLIAVMAAVLINAVLVDGASPLAKVLSTRPLVALGKVSYGLYLWHLVAITLVQRHLHHGGRTAWVLLSIVLTAISTVASWKIIEQPALRLKQRFEMRRDPVAEPAPAAT